MSDIKVNKASSKAYRLYDYLCKNHVGKENMTTVDKLCEIFSSNRREIRDIITEINTYMEFDKIVCRTGGIFIAKDEKELEVAINTANRKAMSFLKEMSCINKKSKLDGQLKMKIGKYFKSYRECFEEE